MDERKRYFKEVDVDQSDGVDFEEYLEVIDNCIKFTIITGIGWLGVLSLIIL